MHMIQWQQRLQQLPRQSIHIIIITITIAHTATARILIGAAWALHYWEAPVLLHPIQRLMAGSETFLPVSFFNPKFSIFTNFFENFLFFGIVILFLFLLLF